MRVDGQHYRTVWAEAESLRPGQGLTVRMIDQRRLPHEFAIREMPTHRETADAIRTMVIRGAPAIGAAGAYGLAQAAAEAPDGEGAPGWGSRGAGSPGAGSLSARAEYIRAAHELLRSTRPTAFDLFFMLDRVQGAIDGAAPERQAAAALAEADRLASASVERCRRIGENGAGLIPDGARVLTHCNAGWLATVDWGTALSPIYHAALAGKRVSVFADETRPRLQGANLTAWELGQEGVDCEIIADNAAGLLMRRGEVDLVITGADRIAINGDAANKIGTYEKAALARAHGIPFYVAAPLSTFDLSCEHGDLIPIEERHADEVLYAYGRLDGGGLGRVRVAPEGARARNPAFDVTPAELITGLITEYGVIPANREAIEATLGRAGDSF